MCPKTNLHSRFILPFGEDHILPFLLRSLDIILRNLRRLSSDSCVINFGMLPEKESYMTKTLHFRVKSDLPCHFEQMLPNSRYNIGFFCSLVKILQTLEVREILFLICGLREGDGNMFPGNPLVEVVFNLNSEQYISSEEEKKLKNLQQLEREQWLTTRAFHLRRTRGG